MRANFIKVIGIQIILVAIFYSSTNYLDNLKNKPSALSDGHTKEKIIESIKQLPDYQKDSLWIDDDNVLHSNNGKIQSVMNQMYVVPANVQHIRNISKSKKESEQLNVYKMTIYYYLLQYGTKTK